MELRLPLSADRPALRLGALALGATVLAAALAFAVTLTLLARIEGARAAGRLALYASGIEAELGRVAHLPHVLADDPLVGAVAAGAPPGPLDAKLAGIAARAGVDAIYLMDRSGLTLAASNAGGPGSFVGQSYAFRPYVGDALRGGTGTFFGVGATTRRPGHFIAEPVRDAAGDVAGVLAVKLDLSRLERDWARADEAVRVLNADGITVLTSRDDWRYRPVAALDDATLARLAATRQFGAAAALSDPLPVPAGMLMQPLDGMPWTVGYRPATGRAALWAFAVAGAVALGMALASFAWAGRRAIRATADLRRVEAKEVALRRMNRRLTREVADRQAAEAQLSRAQAELLRAGRLAVLGRVAASVCHELGQPIAAMRNYLHADGTATTETGRRIDDLLDRLDGIARQLRFFARAEPPAMRAVPLDDVLRYAADVLAGEVERLDAVLRLPDAAPTVRGDAGRLEQVAVNLIRNALDALEGAENRIVRVTAARDGDAVVLTIADSGPGLPVPFDAAVEPFFTTRASGEGTGLGLAIAAEIVREHGGTMTARTSDLGGAAFVLRLPPA